MNTILQKIDKNNPQNDIAVLQKAAYVLKNNGLVAFPTETVYGLGANALNEECVKKIYLAKGRPSDNPLIIHISEIEEIYKLVSHIPKKALCLMQNFWPGALTIVLKKSDIIPYATAGGLDTVAIRLPNNNIARALIKECGFPIAAPSANISGKPSPTNATHVFKDLNGKIDMILDGGNCELGLESTVVEVLEDKVTILRPGNITKEMIEEICGQVFIDKAILQKDLNVLPKSPGMKYKHYAPKGEITIFNGAIENVCEKILNLLSEDNENCVAILCEEALFKYKQFEKYKTLNIGSIKNEAQIAKNLFYMLRECDNINAKKIYIQSFNDTGIGFAIMNRLKKAAAYNIINV